MKAIYFRIIYSNFKRYDVNIRFFIIIRKLEYTHEKQFINFIRNGRLQGKNLSIKRFNLCIHNLHTENLSDQSLKSVLLDMHTKVKIFIL